MVRWLAIVVACLLAVASCLSAGQDDPFSLAHERNPGAKPKTPATTLNPTQTILKELLDLKLTVTPRQVQAGETVKVVISGHLAPGAYTYPMTARHATQSEGQLARIKYVLPSEIKPLSPIAESDFEVDSGKGTATHVKDFTWSQDLYVEPSAKPGIHKVALQVRLMVCTKQSCTVPDYYPTLEADLEVLPGAAAATPMNLAERLKPASARVLDATGTANQPAPVAGGAVPGVDRNDLWGLLGAAFLGAFLMLLTPCVFPMIPITVNFFIKQAEKEHHRPLFMASVYSGTIIVLLTLVMLALGNVVVALANDPWFNVILGGVLILFALSLFGMYEIELPSFLARYTSRHEGQGGLIGTIFMALTFTITSFTCTGPFLGIMLAPVAGIQPPLINLILAAVVYSTTFAAPFFLLALFPTVIKRLPKSGGWMNVIKVTMGFLELGAALKFLANSDYFWNPGNPRLFNFDTVLCAWIALAFATGLYLFGVYRLPHDDVSERPEPIGVLRMMFASAFMGLAVYMVPVLFGITPKGLVMDAIIAFLPPRLQEGPGFAAGNLGSGGSGHLAWHQDYQEAWAEAKRDNKLVFIDFTGQFCTNCRDNEKNVFPRPEVVGELKKYVRLQLYADTVPNPKLSPAQAKQEADRNANWRDQLAKEATLPTYLIFQPAPDQPLEDNLPKGRVLDKRTGTIFDVADFVRFLQEPVKTVQTAAR